MKNKLFTFFSIMLIVSMLAVMVSSAAVVDTVPYEKTVTEDNNATPLSVVSEFTTVTEEETETENKTETDNITAADSDNEEAFSSDYIPETLPEKIPTPNGLYGEDENKVITEKMIAFGREYTGAISSLYSGNAYLFSATRRGTFRFTLRHESYTGAGGWLVTLYNEYYLNGSDGETGLREIGSLICQCDTTVHNSVKFGVLPGSYRVVVTPYGGLVSDTYTITVNFNATTDYEVESNNTRTRYTELYADSPMHGTASFLTDGNDTDWYLLRMYKTGVIRLTFTHAKEDNVAVCWRVVMYDSAGNEIYSENSAFSTATLDSGRLGLEEGIYYVAVYSRVYCALEYTLTAQRLSTAVYESENNDSPETADIVETGTFIYGNTASRQGSVDRDYYRFTLSENGYTEITFNHDETPTEDDKRGWNIRLMTADGTILFAATGSWLETEFTSPRIGLEAGEYLIRIDCDNCYRSSADYGVCVSFTKDDNYETEPNDTIISADMITASTPVTGNLKTELSGYDADYFTFTLDSEAKVDFAFEIPALTAGRQYFSISITDENGNPYEIYLSDGSLPENGIVSIDGKGGKTEFSAVLSQGQYYISVTEGDYFTDSVYMLTYSPKTAEGTVA